MVTRIGQRAGQPRRTYFREWREHRGLTQEQLAEALDATKAAVSKLELGRVLYNQSSLEAWAKALDCEPSDLISHPPGTENLGSLMADAPPSVQDLVIRALRDSKKT